jgi:hypothetical protein
MEIPHLYTFVLEYRGGTYISQINAISLLDAVHRWTNIHKENDLVTWKLSRNGLEVLTTENSPMALDGAIGVWCIVGTVDGHLALVNIIDTRSIIDTRPV